MFFPKGCKEPPPNHERPPHHSKSWEGRGYSSSPQVASTAGSFTIPSQPLVCYQQRIPIFQLLPVSQDLKEYLSYLTIPGSKCQPILCQSKSMPKVQPKPTRWDTASQQPGWPLPVCVMVSGSHSASSKSHHNVSNKDPPILAPDLAKGGNSLERSITNRAHTAAVFPGITSQLPAAST